MPILFNENRVNKAGNRGQLTFYCNMYGSNLTWGQLYVPLYFFEGMKSFEVTITNGQNDNPNTSANDPIKFNGNQYGQPGTRMAIPFELIPSDFSGFFTFKKQGRSSQEMSLRLDIYAD